MGFRRLPEQTSLEEIYYLKIVRRKNIPLVLFIFQLRKQKSLRVLGYIWYTHARVQVYAHECMQRPDQASSSSASHLNALSWDRHVLTETVTFRARLAFQGVLRTLLSLDPQRCFLYGSQRFKLKPLHLTDYMAITHWITTPDPKTNSHFLNSEVLSVLSATTEFLKIFQCIVFKAGIQIEICM